MPYFSYKAINESGKTVEGQLEAESIAGAENILSARGMIPSKVSPSFKKTVTRTGSSYGYSLLLQTVKSTELILFTKQFRSMLMAGVPILRLLQVLEDQSENKLLKIVVASIAQDIRQGTTLTEAMDKHPKVFAPLYRSMVNAGEQSGTLPDTLSRLIYILEHEEKVRSDIRAALQYPIIVLIALGIAFFVLLTFVIPKFITIFEKSGISLPLPTKIAMLLYQFIHHYWILILVVIFGVIMGLRFYFKTDNGKFVRDAFFLRTPLFGPLLRKSAMSRFASIFSILQASGVHVMDAMRILSGTIGNMAISREFERLREKVQEGQGIAVPLRASKYFTPMAVDMIAIGEESGTIDEMLKAVSKHYDEEVEYAVKKLSDALGPILVVGLAVVVGFFALAIFLPMWDLTKMVK
jgi:type II secretory pathway component PulF